MPTRTSMKKTRTRDRFNDEDTMKKILYILPAVAMVLFSCSKVQEGPLYDSNGDDGKEIHFIQSSLEKEFGTDLTEGTIDVVIARPGNSGDYSVGILNRGDDSDAFSIPESVIGLSYLLKIFCMIHTQIAMMIRATKIPASPFAIISNAIIKFSIISHFRLSHFINTKLQCS